LNLEPTKGPVRQSIEVQNDLISAFLGAGHGKARQGSGWIRQRLLLVGAAAKYRRHTK
jgi:hypothetical protein